MEKLSNEMLFEILSCLDFFDLIRCSRVSKSFRALTEDSAFDKTLFRSKAVVTDASTITIYELRMNPAFERFTYQYKGKIEEAGDLFLYRRSNCDTDYRTVPLKETSAGNLNATEPPVACMKLDYVYKVANGQGITVLDVMKGFVSHHGVNSSNLFVMSYGITASDQPNKDIVSIYSGWGF